MLFAVLDWTIILLTFDNVSYFRYLATTQFEATRARRAFPCFDEPAIKAKFNITLVRKDHMTSLSNIRIIYQENR